MGQTAFIVAPCGKFFLRLGKAEKVMYTTVVAAHAQPVIADVDDAPTFEPTKFVSGRLWDFPGFAPLTRIETEFGDFHAQTLRVRDRVRTRRGPPAQIRWLDRVVLNEDFLHRHPEAQPILVPANALGHGLPKRDILLSPGQKIFAEGGFAPRRVITAAQLLDTGKARRKPETMVTYTFFTCASPVEVKVEGVWAPLEPPRW